MRNNNHNCAQKLKIIADNTRLSVLEILMESPKHVGEINERLGIEQSLLSHHLKVLRQAGLVEAIRDGKGVLYQITYRFQPDSKNIDLGCCILSFN